MPNSQPPSTVVFMLPLLGTGYIDIKPTVCSKSFLWAAGKNSGSHEPPIKTATFLSIKSLSNPLMLDRIGFMPAAISLFKNCAALTPAELLYVGNQYIPFVGCPSFIIRIFPPSIHRYGYHSVAPQRANPPFIPCS